MKTFMIRLWLYPVMFLIVLGVIVMIPNNVQLHRPNQKKSWLR